MPNYNPQFGFKPKYGKTLSERLQLRLTPEMLEAVRSEGHPPDVIRDAIAHFLDCPLNSPEVATGLDALASAHNLSRSELIERIGRGLFTITPTVPDCA